MSRFDLDREDVIRLLYSVLDYARLGAKVNTYNNCNNCGWIKSCGYAPPLGGVVRWNCPLWASNEEAENNDRSGEDPRA